MISKRVFLCFTAFLCYGASVHSFECPEPFGVFPDPEDDQYYYVCENNLPLRGDCNNPIFVPDFCNKKNSSCLNSGNFTTENGTNDLNDTFADYESFDELNCTQTNNSSVRSTNITNGGNETNELENFPHYLSDNETVATNMSSINETDIYSCNDTLSLEMDFPNSQYVVKCGNDKNGNETNSKNDTDVDYENFGDSSNNTLERNGSYVLGIFPHFTSENGTAAMNMSSFNNSSNQTFSLSIDAGYVGWKNLSDNSTVSTSTAKIVEGTTVEAWDSKESTENTKYNCPGIDENNSCLNSGNFTNENGTNDLNDTFAEYDNFEEINSTQTNNSSGRTTNITNEGNETNEFENFPHYLSDNETVATNMSSINETDISSCNDTLSLEMDLANSQYVVTCGNATNGNETNSKNDTDVDYENFVDSSNNTLERNDTYVLDIFPHFTSETAGQQSICLCLTNLQTKHSHSQ